MGSGFRGPQGFDMDILKKFMGLRQLRYLGRMGCWDFWGLGLSTKQLPKTGAIALFIIGLAYTSPIGGNITKSHVFLLLRPECCMTLLW